MKDINFNQPTAEMVDCLRASATKLEAKLNVAKALELPLRKGILRGNNLANIFEEVNFAPGVAVEFPMDFLSPGTEKDFVAYTIPSLGRIPERHVEADYVMVSTFDVANSIDTHWKYIRDARWDVVRRMMEVMEAGFIRKFNTDGWHVVLAAGAGRNIVGYDDAAVSGLFTKRVVALGKTLMRRNTGGNATSMGQGVLSDLYLSPESLEDIRSWDLSQIDEFTRRDIFMAGDGQDKGEAALTTIFGVRLHMLDELGVAQEYTKYYTNTLGATLPTDKTELMVGLDLVNKDSFISPIRTPVEMFEDPTFHRQRRWGLYGYTERGWAALNSQRVLLLAS